jgi:hypothetical protein
MNPWAETVVAVFVALAGVALGRWFSRLPKPYWTLGYFIPLALILLYVLALHIAELGFIPPVSWMMSGRRRFAIFGFITTLMLTTPLPKLHRKEQQVGVVLLQFVFVFTMGVWPYLAPALNRGYLAQLKTRIDAEGICRQSNDYNCGPAAAVTALRKLGLPAEEGEIAILTHTSRATGTEPDVLAQKLQAHYGKDGLIAEYRVFKSISELKAAGLTLAVVKFNFMVDHFVTVLEVTDKDVIVGDPLEGRAVLSHKAFEEKWLFVGVVLKRTQPPASPLK